MATDQSETIVSFPFKSRFVTVFRREEPPVAHKTHHGMNVQGKLHGRLPFHSSEAAPGSSPAPACLGSSGCLKSWSQLATAGHRRQSVTGQLWSDERLSKEEKTKQEKKMFFPPEARPFLDADTCGGG